MRTSGAILVVDTDHAVADLIMEILRADGYAISVARDRMWMRASVAKQRPALVLLDNHVASMNTAACTRTSPTSTTSAFPSPPIRLLPQY